MLNKVDLSTPNGAIFSPNREYRYALWRVWNQACKPLMVIGLNPSKANEYLSDPTVTRGMTRAYNEGFGGLLMGNLYAYVSTNPELLTLEIDTLGRIEPIGDMTDFYLKHMISLAGKVVCGWGSFPAVNSRADAVLAMIPEPYCLGINKDGHPKHPLYVSYSTPMVKYSRERGS